MNLNKMKIICLLICTLFLTSIYSGLATAKNLVSIDMSITNSNVNLNDDLIKITNIYPVCDMDNDFVVYTYGTNFFYDHLYIYDIKTGDTDDLFLGGDMVFPKIFEHRVVFYDFVYGGFKMYNIDTSEETDLIVTNWPGGESDSFQYFGDYIVYENTVSGEYETEIFLYNISTGENIQLTDSPGEVYTQNPCIYKNIVAWQINDGNLADIVMYDMDSKKYTRVTNTSQFEAKTFPSVYDNNIVYSYFYYDKVSGTIIYSLKMYNITTGDETTILTGEEPTGSTPEIFGDIIAYSEPGVSLRLYYLRTNYDKSIYEGEMLAYPWNLNENYVLFTVVKDGVYLYKFNNPPNPPEINGPASGKPGISYNFIFNAVDPDGDQVKYIINWGDGKTDTTVLNPSGQDMTLTHIWDEKGEYTIKVYAQDENGFDGPESTKTVSIPRNRVLTWNFLLIKVLERFQILDRILKL